MTSDSAPKAPRAPRPAPITFWQRLKLLWGRPRRFVLNHFRPGYVAAQLAKRRGECARCGACCQMGAYCRHLVYEDDTGLSACKRYDKFRSMNCRNFPIDERDLADRNLVFPDVPCGYYFENGGDAPDARDAAEQA